MAQVESHEPIPNKLQNKENTMNKQIVIAAAAAFVLGNIAPALANKGEKAAEKVEKKAEKVEKKAEKVEKAADKAADKAAK